jgi:hypothetical protein
MGEPCTGGGRGICQLGRVWNVKWEGGTQLGIHRERTNEEVFFFTLKLNGWCVVGVGAAT